MRVKRLLSVLFLLGFIAMFCATGSYGKSYSIWPSTATPSTPDVGGGSGVELGVSFKTDVSGYITGIRFYKSAGNTGTHVGNLWSSTGALLATATFTSETASGWQQVNFSNPVAITANTVYVASYHSAIGHWSVDYNYFASSGVDNAPLHALANVGGTPDGRYAWGSSSVFPASGIGANYWVDVAFLSAGGEGSTQTGQLTTSPTSLGFGNVLVGSTSTAQTIILKNVGTSSLSISQVNVTGSGFAASGITTPLTLAVGQSASLSVTFAPASTGSVTGSISLANSANSSPTSIALNGAGVQASLTVTPASASFGNVTVAASNSQTFTLSNPGSASVAISQANLTGTGFTLSGLTTPLTIAAGNSATFNAVFSPTAATSSTGSISLVSNAPNSPLGISLSGTGVQPQIAVSPASASFGNVTVGASNSQTFTLSNPGSASVAISQANLTGTGFTLSGLTIPLTIAAGNSATFNAVFSPTAATSSTGSISLVSNAPNSPLAISLSGSGLTATRLLGANPTSLSFGNVNTGGSSSLNVTLTNSGNSNVTISSVNASGSGYSASGVSANTTLTPGQSATLNVAFAPTTAGNPIGSVSVASDATNSPAAISLSGSGVAQTTSGTPTCGKSGDSTNYVPTDWTTFVPPGKGQSYVDPTFGCTVTRISDASQDVWNGSSYLPITHGYSTVSPFNANDTYLLLSDGWGRRYVTDLKGNSVVPTANMPGANNGWVLWDATNASAFYYTSGNSLMKGTISGSTVATATVHQFGEYGAINFMDETDVSQDGAHVVVIGGDTSGSSPENVFVYNFVANTKGPVYTTSCTGSVDAPNNGCLHKLIQTPDNNVAIDFASDGSGPEQGVRLWDGVTSLLHLQDSTNHMDAGYDLNGNAVYIEVGNSTYTLGITNPCPSGWGLDVRQINNPQSAVCLLDNQPSWHVGYRGNAQQPWVGLSFDDQLTVPDPEWFANSSNYTAPTSSNWALYKDEIIVVRIDANNSSSKVYRLARGYSRTDEDFNAQLKGAISRDGKYIAFDSNMAYAQSGCPANFQTSTNCTDVYVVKVQ